jgi:hypothetical protein
LLGNMLYGVNPIDAVTYAGVIALLGCVALAGCFAPALTASRVHPMTTLRQEQCPDPAARGNGGADESARCDLDLAQEPLRAARGGRANVSPWPSFAFLRP